MIYITCWAQISCSLPLQPLGILINKLIDMKEGDTLLDAAVRNQMDDDFRAALKVPPACLYLVGVGPVISRAQASIRKFSFT